MITGVEIETFCYPTEDMEKVKRAFLTISPINPDISRVSTHFGVDILVLRAKLKKKSEIREFLSRLAKLSESEKDELRKSLETRVDDKGNLYIRLDKFSALDGEIHLAEREPIKVVIKFTTFPFDRSKILKEIEGIL